MELEECRERHPDEEGRPADHEDPHDDANRAGGGGLALTVLKRKREVSKVGPLL